MMELMRVFAVGSRVRFALLTAVPLMLLSGCERAGSSEMRFALGEEAPIQPINPVKVAEPRGPLKMPRGADDRVMVSPLPPEIGGPGGQSQGAAPVTPVRVAPAATS